MTDTPHPLSGETARTALCATVGYDGSCPHCTTPPIGEPERLSDEEVADFRKEWLPRFGRPALTGMERLLATIDALTERAERAEERVESLTWKLEQSDCAADNAEATATSLRDERDEANQKRDSACQRRDAAQSMQEEAESRAAAAESRAERAQRVVEAAKEVVGDRVHGVGGYSPWECSWCEGETRESWDDASGQWRPPRHDDDCEWVHLTAALAEYDSPTEEERTGKGEVAGYCLAEDTGQCGWCAAGGACPDDPHAPTEEEGEVNRCCTCGIAEISPKDWIGVPIMAGENPHASDCPLSSPAPTVTEPE